MEFGVTVALRPEAERDRGQFVHQRIGQAVFCEINGLDVSVANVAALDSYVRELVSSVDWQFGWIFLATSGAGDAAELPFAETETAD